MSIESSWSDAEWCEYLSGSSDPDDVSLSARLRIVEYLKAKRVLNQREEHWLELLRGMNAVELGFLKQPSSYRITHSRPCSPRWHWPEELEELFCRSLKEGQ
jgi:hypothetical protein